MTNPYARHAKEYRYQEVMGASPVRLIIIAYDVAITACQQHDLKRATEALSVLRNSINFKHGEIAGRLFALYIWCADQARAGQWEDAIKILSELRDAWIQVERRASPAPVQQSVPANQAAAFQPAPVMVA